MVWTGILIDGLPKLFSLQIRKKLPKVNRTLAARLLESEEAENEKRDAGDDENKKSSKKKKGLTMQDLQDERFKEIFTNKVL